MNYPDQGELYKASDKKSEALVFFVHFYGGHKKALRRHVQFVNSLGFDAYAFNIRDEVRDHGFFPYARRSRKFGLKHAIADQIEGHLDLLQKYPKKIMFAFSNISACAIEVMARRPHDEFLGMITDSGPSAHFFKSVKNLFTYSIPMSPLKRLLMSPVFALVWSRAMHKDIQVHLKSLPRSYPVLSIRGWKDPLISPTDIDEVYESCKNLNWRKLDLPEAGHLNGLRDFGSDYKPAVEKFLLTLPNS